MLKSDLSRNPQKCYNSLMFFAVLDSLNKNLKHCTVQNRSKNRRNWNPEHDLLVAESETK